MPPDRIGTCEYHLDCEKAASAARTEQENQKRSLDALWLRYNQTDREVQQHSGVLGPVQRDLEAVKSKVETRGMEDQAYQALSRVTKKDVEGISHKLDEFALKKETATKESVEDISKWVRYGWLATIFAILLLVANIVLMVIPLIWKKGGP